MPSWSKLCIMSNKIQKGYKNQLPLLRCLEQKQRNVHDPCTQLHQKGGQTTKSPLQPHPLICLHLQPIEETTSSLHFLD